MQVGRSWVGGAFVLGVSLGRGNFDGKRVVHCELFVIVDRS
jgi:hypothetical protein